MTEQTLFSELETVIDPDKDYLPDLVGEGKKFKTVADLARSVLHKDSHIRKLEHETKELREDLVKRSTVDDLLEKLAQKQAPTAETTNQLTPSGEPSHNDGTTKTPQILSRDDVRGILNEEKLAEQRSKNLEAVQKVLTETLGSEYLAYLKQKQQDLGLSEKDLTELALSKPKAFLKLMDVAEARQKDQSELSIFNPARGTVNTSPMMRQKPQTGRKTFAEWQELRKTNAREYHAQFSKRYQDAVALGEEFYNQ